MLDQVLSDESDDMGSSEIRSVANFFRASLFLCLLLSPPPKSENSSEDGKVRPADRTSAADRLETPSAGVLGLPAAGVFGFTN